MTPFPGGIESLPNGSLILSLAAAVVYLAIQGRSPSLRRSIAKTSAVGLLALIAFLQGGPTLLIVALTLSALGDAFLAQAGAKPFLAGLVSFLLAHIAYIALFLATGDGLAILFAEPWRIALCGLAIIAAAILSNRLLPAAGPQMRLPVALYVITILAMLLAAGMVRAPIIAVGATLFVLSDSLLAIGRFLLRPADHRQTMLGPAVWISYYLAQLAIMLGFVI